jgi:hypothetical protein
VSDPLPQSPFSPPISLAPAPARADEEATPLPEPIPIAAPEPEQLQEHGAEEPAEALASEAVVTPLPTAPVPEPPAAPEPQATPEPEPAPELPPAATAPLSEARPREPHLPPPHLPEPLASADPVPSAVLPDPVAVPAYRVCVRLTNGEGIAVAVHEDERDARTEATTLMRYLRDGRGDWPYVAGRYVRPETIVSVDVDVA